MCVDVKFKFLSFHTRLDFIPKANFKFSRTCKKVVVIPLKLWTCEYTSLCTLCMLIRLTDRVVGSEQFACRLGEVDQRLQTWVALLQHHGGPHSSLRALQSCGQALDALL